MVLLVKLAFKNKIHDKIKLKKRDWKFNNPPEDKCCATNVIVCYPVLGCQMNLWCMIVLGCILIWKDSDAFIWL